MEDLESLIDNNSFYSVYYITLEKNRILQEFINLYLQCIKIDDKEKMFNNLKGLYSYSFEYLDFDFQNFCLKFIKKQLFGV